MNKQPSRNIIPVLLLLMLASFTLVACSSTQPTSNPPATQEQAVPATQEQIAPATQAQSAPVVLDGAALVQERCSVCHNLDRVENAQKSADEWAATVTRMVGKGAKLDQAEQEAVIQFLAQAYP